MDVNFDCILACSSAYSLCVEVAEAPLSIFLPSGECRQQAMACLYTIDINFSNDTKASKYELKHPDGRVDVFYVKITGVRENMLFPYNRPL